MTKQDAIAAKNEAFKEAIAKYLEEHPQMKPYLAKVEYGQKSLPN